uniref:Blast resistance protein n=1 Tax=Oryza sativa subsp. indica TaxID=39946 RepID=C0LMX7_ORYSI|nr:blast resistance protein [Oryza sativa Indica Group]ADO17324.1 blast resistance protein [Oryza sativa Indica Group]
MAEGVVGSLIVKLGDALASEAVEVAKSLLGLEGSALKRLFSEIGEVKGELESIHAFLQAAERFKDADETTSAFVKQVRSLALSIEDVVDEFTYELGEGDGRMGMAVALKRMCKMGTWSRLAGNLQDIKVNLKNAAERRIRYDLKGVERGAKSTAGRRSSNWRSDSVLFKREDELVGIEKKRDLLMKWVKDEEQRRMVVSVWGMGGIGKTALVANVYNAIKADFDTCAWITVSQSYEADDLLRRTAQEFRKNDRKKDFPVDVDITNYRGLVETTRSYLENKRYVLVLDDVWNANVWFDSKDAFEDGNIGRIILTSRNYDVALLAHETHIINLQPLEKHHAWDLFCKEAFWKNEIRNCPPELQPWANNFVDKCNGLPIAIVCIGRLLSFQGSTYSDWEKVYKNLEMQLTNNSIMDMMNIILKISLEDLPHNIKNCFLYCSMFPENYVMKRKSLVRLWVAEGFIEETEHRTLEEVAEHYLTELVNRCLLLLVKRNEAGHVHEVQMHDILRVLALSKAREQNFCIVVNHSRSTHLIGEARRLSIQRGDFAQLADHAPHLRSLLLFQSSPNVSSLHSLPKSVKLLSVLDLTDSSVDRLPKEVFGLFNLRFLGLRRTKISKLPSSIGRLKNLLVLDAWKCKIVKLPLAITKLQKLTHLIVTSKAVVVSKQFVPSVGVPAPLRICSMTTLQTLLLMEASSQMVHHLGSLVELRTFRISKVRSCHCEQLFMAITNMIHLTRLGIQADSSQEVLHLESLKPPPLLQKLFLQGTLSHESLPHFVSVSNLNNLTFLRLAGSRIDENAFLNLEGLQQLVKLQLYDAFDGMNIYFHENSFPKLRILKIWGAPHLNEIKMTKGAVASLTHLKFLLCPNLKQLPCGIEHVRTLEELTLDHTAEELVDRVRRKKERMICDVQRVYVGFIRNGVLAAERIQ